MPKPAHRIEREGLFEAALDSRAEQHEGTFSVGGRRLAVRCVGLTHWAQLSESLLRTVGVAELTFDLWDPDEAGIAAPPVEWPAGSELRPGSHGEAFGLLPGGEAARYAGPDFDVRLDRCTGCLTGWVAAARLSPWHRLRPWQSLLVPALASAGVESVHASMPVRGGSGVLVAGENGAGKSTTAFSCLAAGFDLLGDDAIGVELVPEGPLGHTLHAVAKLSEHGIARFPALAARSVRYDDPAEIECFVKLAELAPPRAVASAGLAAIAFPRLVESVRSTVVPLRPSRAAAELLRHMLSVEPGRLQALFETALRLAAAVPAFRLEVGRDPSGPAGAIETILARTA